MGSELPIPEELHRRMIRLRVNEGDLVERFIRGSGPGGQKINKTSSCVQIKHLVSGIEVKCQKSRSLMANRITARSMICSIIEEKEAKKRNSRRAEREKERRRNRQPSRRQKRLNVENKRKQGEKKRMRSRPRFEKE
tara:strand:- start:709 stop:1119 length:411 start_codon:yes stop_codon:yes gene_type:complete